MFTDPISDLRSRCRTVPLVIDDVLPELAAQFRESILADADRYASAPSLNRGGWKSDGDSYVGRHLLKAAFPELDLRAYTIGAWSMVNRNGSEHARHQHCSAAVSGVYYVATGDPAVSTYFETTDGEIAVAPRPGRLALFLGECWHRVPRYLGTEPRVTIAFDIKR